MASEVGEVLGVVPVTAGGGGAADLAPHGHPSSRAPDAATGSAPADIVELSSQAPVASPVKLLGRAPQPELQLSPERLRAMVSRDTSQNS
jgi:hypothetical protein